MIQSMDKPTKDMKLIAFSIDDLKIMGIELNCPKCNSNQIIKSLKKWRCLYCNCNFKIPMVNK